MSVDTASLDINLHLFHNDTARVQQQQQHSISPADVALSASSYLSQDPSSSSQSNPAQDGRAEHPDNKDISSQDSSISTPESSISVIQLLEGEAPDQTAGIAGDEVGSSDDSQEWSSDGDSQEHKRVKVYELVGSRWEDQGTAFCYGHFDESTNEAQLVARSEADLDTVILSTTIRSNDVYQRQQETLIVWTEPDGVDYALSFQETEGCSEVWNFINEVQQHMKTSEDHGFGPTPSTSTGHDQDPALSTSKLIHRGSLPEPRMGIIGEIEKIIKTLSRTAVVKDKMCEWMLREGYVLALIDVLAKAEDLESLENLHALCSCMQTILLLNDHTIYEHILDDHVFPGVVGMLEYDPEFPGHKANYREFLRQTARFHQPIPIRDEGVQRKIHHTYRLQFLKDVVLARVLDDSTFNVINSCIIFNQIDIISHVQAEKNFLTQIVDPYLDDSVAGVLWWRDRVKELDKNKVKKDEAMDVEGPSVSHDGRPLDGRTNGPAGDSSSSDSSSKSSEASLQIDRRSVIVLIQQLCAMGKNVQLPARLALFRTLIDRAILFPVQWALSHDEKDLEGRQMIAAGGEILCVLLDHDLSGVRGFIMRQTESVQTKSDTLLALMCKMITRSRDLAVQSQMGDALKLMLEIPIIDPNDQSQTAMQLKLMQGRPKDDPTAETFINYFYRQCIDNLFKPFLDIPEFKNLTESGLVFSREKTNIYLYLCDVLCNCALQHSFRSHIFILSSHIVLRVASLLTVRDKHLRLAAFRLFRIFLKLNNNILFEHLKEHDILLPILDLTLRESKRDNLLSASCQEFFDHIRKENMKVLIEHCMLYHQAKIKKLAETPLAGPLFSALIRRSEMNSEPPPSETPSEANGATDKTINGARQWVPTRGLNKDEERYFSEDGPDDEDEPIRLVGPPAIASKGNVHMLKRKRMAAGVALRSSTRPPHVALPRTPPIGSLVDYGDDDEDDLGGIEDVTSSNRRKTSRSPTGPPATPRLSHRRIASQIFQPLPTPDEDEDEEDSLLEALVSKAPGPSTIATKQKSTALGPKPNPQFSINPMRAAGEKRRRDEDEDDGLFERLATKAKRHNSENGSVFGAISGAKRLGGGSGGQEGVACGAAVGGGGGPRKIKLKFGPALSAAAATTVAKTSLPPTTVAQSEPSETGVKDGDTG